VGLVAVVEAAHADAVIAAFRDCGERAFAIGSLVENGDQEPQVRFSGRLEG
jgi:hypothetical protein